MSNVPGPNTALIESLPAAHEAWVGVVRAYNLCDAVLSERIESLGLKTSEHEVIVSLLLYPGVTQQQLASHSFTAKSVMSVLVSKLEKSGLIERTVDERDSRAWRLHLTAKGEKLARRALAIQNEVVTAMTAQFTPAELVELTAASQRACRALEKLRR